MAITLTVAPLSQTVAVGTDVEFTATFTGDDTVKEIVSYAWLLNDSVLSGETSDTIAELFDTEGDFEVKCRVVYALVADDGAAPVTITSTASTITVEEIPVIPEGHWFVNPLEFKNSSFTWLPYWIHDWMKANPAWRDDPVNSPWPKVTYAIDKAVTDYGDCLMQESRNGYIYKASQFVKS
ncbi:capsid and scaffold protein [Aeromonas phage SW69-9]|uniref:Head outer capsid protein n=2 Tax=Biquartavirus 44RR2 TaxID=115987 RepID=Q6U9D0_9CAUD|nr:Hoc-like head decoration [Aeromonas phage 44RR2.8t]AAQ81490.1 head outer capsid protein [Aeromonas phage 44RR2.8t]APU00644.1 capsid and scaffold protein [Aeromonas phage 44RR2.8t.2]APU02226.1 capsid and scaffold protein [Aeromonas phage Riv-10]APU02472.1 capsid and scaffold protein [Aeromonas phage SW69-9]